MSRHHNMANDFYEEHVIMLDCSLCYSLFERDVPEGSFHDKVEAAKEAHREGWRFYKNKNIMYKGSAVTIYGPVCPKCNKTIT